MSDTASLTEEDTPSREELLTQVELLEEENQALYESYTRAKQTQYRRTAIGLVGIAVVATVAGLAIPPARTILLSLAGIGFFGGVLTLYLTPEQFIASDTGRDVYTALAENEQAIVTELGLTEERVYIPTPDTDDPAKLFVPQRDEYALPDSSSLANTIIASENPPENGVAFVPSGTRLFESFTRALSGSLGDTPSALGTQLTDALTAQFELVETARAEVDTTTDAITITVSGSAYGPLTRFNHPVVSFIAVGLATGLDRAVTATVSDTGIENGDYRIRYYVDTNSGR
ncbi:hypothetical protein [Halobellus sp. EA9]|uniref:hypothetical protein n=1 Tax=Halobellus sp. EA9 TaxID=3421647 RepID=UPI003EBF5EF7